MPKEHRNERNTQYDPEELLRHDGLVGGREACLQESKVLQDPTFVTVDPHRQEPEPRRGRRVPVQANK